MKSPSEIVKLMLENDHFSQWLGIQVLEISKGQCKLSFSVKKEMLNGFSIAHGGITYSLSDSCLAFAANSYGYKAFSIETSISHLKKLKENQYIFATCTEINRSNKLGKYEVKIHDENEDLISIFYGTVYISKEIW